MSTSTATATRPATDKQVALIDRLLGERSSFTNEAQERFARDSAATDARFASSLIDRLLAAPRRQALPAAQPGYYIDGDTVYRVVANKAGTGTYAKRMEIEDGKGRWVYAPGAGSQLAAMSPLTVEEAARLGHEHGVCMVCGRELTNAASVQAGIGPVCASRL